MRRVLKFPLTVGLQRIELGGAGRVVLFGRDGRQVTCVWFEVEDTRPPCPWLVRVYNTGDVVQSDHQWQASFIDGPLVYHLYGRPE